jgi:hypothetical protein
VRPQGSRRPRYDDLVVKTPRRDAVDERPVERPRGSRVVLECPAAGVLVIGYRNSRRWAARAFLLAVLWVALAAVPLLLWGWAAYRSVVFVLILLTASLSFLLQWVFGWVSRTRGVLQPFVIAVLAVAAWVALYAGIAYVLRADELAALRPVAVGAIWLLAAAFVLRWLSVRHGEGELRIDRERCTCRMRALGLSRSRQCRTDRIIAIGSRRPRPHLAPNMPRGGLGHLMAWRFEKGPLAGVAAGICIVAAFRLASFVPIVLVAGCAVLIISVSRTAYPITILTRRRALRFGHHLTTEEQAWLAYELRTYMQQIGHPVKRSLHRP